MKVNKLNDLLARCDALIILGQSVIKKGYIVDGALGIEEFVKRSDMAGFKAASLSLIANIFGESHVYFHSFQKETNGIYKENAQAGVQILKSIREEVLNGWFFSFKSIVSAEIFSDFFSMAEYLLDEGYKDAAAVMIGSLLEEHLRQLCKKNSIDIEEVDKNGKLKPIKSDRLNSELAKKSVYSALDQKNVTGWLHLRNKAAHGEYGEYSLSQVVSFKNSISEFIARVSI